MEKKKTMENTELIKWLIDNGGPAIKLNMIKEGMLDKNLYDLNMLAAEMLHNEEVKNVVDYLDQFKEYTNDFDALVHNAYPNCIETFMPVLLSLGFQSGIKVFDDKIKILENVLPISVNNDLNSDKMPFAAIIVMFHLLKAGYYSQDIENYVKHRLNYIHKVSLLGRFDFYEDDAAKLRQVAKWKGKTILKDMYNPYIYNQSWEIYPLPIIYDIKLILYFYDKTNDEIIKQKIDDVMKFILNPLYQETKGDYGWHWDFNKNTYHASTRGYELPLYNSDELGSLTWLFLDYLDLATYSPILLKSDWMKKCINFLENYKTEKGTYLFPENYFNYLTHHSSIPKGLFYRLFISKDVLASIKRNDIKSTALELYGTFLMMKLKKRLSANN
jgi:hypothetical protein